MTAHYLKIAWRNIRKNKLYSFVNVAGLTVGIASCILIGLYISNELSFDRFHENADRIARVTMEYKGSGTVQQTAVTGTKAGPQLQRTFPQIEAFSRCIKYDMSVANGPDVFDEKDILFADSAFLRLFSFRLVRGNAASALASPNKVILSETEAKKIFGSADPLGRVLRFNDVREYEVTGVVEDAPVNSQIRYSMIASFSSLNASKKEEWWSANYVTYLLLNANASLPQLQTQVSGYMATVSRDELKSTGGDYLTYKLEPLRAVHLRSELDGLEPNGNLTYVYVLGAIAILILLIACVNYVNLATAQSASRSIEIGVRKVMGAGRGGLFRQFIGESFVLTCIALLLGLLTATLLLPLFNEITGRLFSASMLFRPLPLLSLAVLAIVISFASGAYPAFILSSQRLSTILRSGFRISSSGGGLRRSLIVVQFVISVFLITGTIVIMKQIRFIRQRDMGYDKEQVLVLPVDPKTEAQYTSLKQAFAMNPNVLSVSGAYEGPTFVGWGDGITADDGKTQKDLSVTAMPVDLGFVKTMGMKIIAGGDFTESDLALQDTAESYKNYRNSFIINEHTAKELGWTAEEAVGKTISRGAPGTVKAVLKDFNFQSVHNPIGPLVMFLDTTQIQQMFIKVRSENLASTVAALGNTWSERIRHRPFTYHFMDEDFDSLYSSEERTAKLFVLFSSLAIALACLGLFALAAFSTIQRTKEIGIRKILGATVGNITLLVSREFLGLVLIAILIAAPLAWWAGSSWLGNFAYRVEISWWIFVLGALVALLIALATVSYHSIKAALSNPVQNLRAE